MTWSGADGKMTGEAQERGVRWQKNRRRDRELIGWGEQREQGKADEADPQHVCRAGLMRLDAGQVWRERLSGVTGEKTPGGHRAQTNQ